MSACADAHAVGMAHEIPVGHDRILARSERGPLRSEETQSDSALIGHERMIPVALGLIRCVTALDRTEVRRLLPGCGRPPAAKHR